MREALSVECSQSAFDARIDAIRSNLVSEYLQPHHHPWIIGYSGGKDSTLVLHLVFEMLLDLPRSERKRQVHIVSNDTLVESPLVIAHIHSLQELISDAASAFGLPFVAVTTKPETEHTFWVNLIGRGYPSPNRTFRWCTDRMKILPTSRYIREQANCTGEVILLLGVRRSESSVRASVVARYDNGQRLNRHNDLTGCMVFRPIVDLSTIDVWEFLTTHPPPWGSTHEPLIKLYRDAQGGECPVVMQKSDAPSCGTSSSRFGCWTCTVVEKDRSLEGFVDAGFAEFGPLLDFRDWLVTIRNDPTRRMARRRDGRVTITPQGTFVPGPFTMATRTEILTRLFELQTKTGTPLISDAEVGVIKRIWAEDVLANSQPADW